MMKQVTMANLNIYWQDRMCNHWGLLGDEDSEATLGLYELRQWLIKECSSAQHSGTGDWYAPTFKQLPQESLRAYAQRCMDVYVAELEKGWKRMNEGERRRFWMMWM